MNNTSFKYTIKIMETRKIIFTLSAIFLVSGLMAQINVGPHNNVGVRTEEDSTVSLIIKNGGDELDLNAYNLYSDLRVDSLSTSSSGNGRFESIWNEDYSGFKYFRGLTNNMRIYKTGLSGIFYGLFNRVIDDYTIPTEGSNNPTRYSIYNDGHFREENGDNYGLRNYVTLYHADAADRYGIDNVVTTMYPNDTLYGNVDQYGIHNYLMAQPNINGEASIPAYALWSGINGNQPNYYAGYFAGDVIVTGIPYFPSDSVIKQNVVSITNGLNKILQLNPISFDFKPELNYNFSNGLQYGLIAQELEAVLPDLVREQPFVELPDVTHSVDSNGDPITESAKGDFEYFKTVQYLQLIPFLIKAIQEQQVLIEDLQQQIGGLQGNPSGK